MKLRRMHIMFTAYRGVSLFKMNCNASERARAHVCLAFVFILLSYPIKIIVNDLLVGDTIFYIMPTERKRNNINTKCLCVCVLTESFNRITNAFSTITMNRLERIPLQCKYLHFRRWCTIARVSLTCHGFSFRSTSLFACKIIRRWSDN